MIKQMHSFLWQKNKKNIKISICFIVLKVYSEKLVFKWCGWPKSGVLMKIIYKYKRAVCLKWQKN